MLKDVAQTRVSVFGRFVGSFFQNGQGLDIRPVLGGLDVFHIEMLHAQPPAASLGFHLGNNGLSPGAQGQKFPAFFRVADGGGQADAPGIDPSQPAQPLNQTQCLPTPVPPEQGVHLVDDHKTQISEKAGDGGVLVQQHGLQGFRGDLQNAGGMLHHPGLVALSHISVPVPHRNVRLGAQVIQPEELVVDQRFQRADVDGAHGGGGVFGKQGDDGEEGRLGFTGGGGGSEQQIFVGIEDCIRRCHLDGPEVRPVVAVDIILDKGGVTVKCTHSLAS